MQNPDMTSDPGLRHLLGVIDDLEQQAEGLALRERDVEVADRARTEFGRVPVMARLHAQLDQRLRIRLLGGTEIDGTVERTGEDWFLISDDPGRHWLIRTAAVGVVTGASPRSLPDELLGVVRRLPLRSLLRGLATEPDPCGVLLTDGSRVDGRIGRVGQDFVETVVTGGQVAVVPFEALAAVVRRR